MSTQVQEILPGIVPEGAAPKKRTKKAAVASDPALNEFRTRCLDLMIELTGPIPDFQVQVPAIEWLYKSPYSEEQIIILFNELLIEARASKKFRVSWALVKSRIGSRFAPPVIESEEISAQLKRDIEFLDRCDESLRAGLTAYLELSDEEQDRLIAEKIEEFYSSPWARVYKRWSSQELADKAVYEISKELGE